MIAPLVLGSGWMLWFLLGLATENPGDGGETSTQTCTELCPYQMWYWCSFYWLLFTVSWCPIFFPFTLLRSDPAKLETKWASPAAHCSLYGSMENGCSYMAAGLALLIAWHHLGALALLQDVVHAGHFNEWDLMVWATHWTCCPPLVPKMVLQWVAWTLTLLVIHGAIGALGAFDHGAHCSMHSHMVKLHGHPPTSHMMMALGIWQPMDKKSPGACASVASRLSSPGWHNGHLFAWPLATGRCASFKCSCNTWHGQWHPCPKHLWHCLHSTSWHWLPKALPCLMVISVWPHLAWSWHMAKGMPWMNSSPGSWMVGSVILALFAGVISCTGTMAIAGQNRQLVLAIAPWTTGLGPTSYYINMEQMLASHKHPNCQVSINGPLNRNAKTIVSFQFGLGLWLANTKTCFIYVLNGYPTYD